MRKGKTYHRLLAAYVEDFCQYERQGMPEDLAPAYPSCADLRLAKAVCLELPDGKWQVDLIVKPLPGTPAFRRIPLRRCRNQKEAEILAAYSQKVMQPAQVETEAPFPFN